jgi:hypothetical protein
MKRSQAAIGSMRKSVLRLAGAYISLRSIGSVTSAAREQIRSERKLAAVIRATGGAAGFSLEQMKEYASELQNVTNFGDEATLSAMGILATYKNIKGDMFKLAVERAMDIAETFGGDLESNINLMGKALNDPIEGMSALKKKGVVLSAQDKVRVRQLQLQGDLLGAQKILMAEIAGQVGGVARRVADPITQMGDQWSDIKEKLGQGILFVVQPFTHAITEGLKQANWWMDKLGKSVKNALGPMEKMTLKWERVVWALKLIKDLQPWFWIQGPADFFPPGVGIGKNGKAGGKDGAGDGPGDGVADLPAGQKFAGAMLRGTQQAYSTILNATSNKQNQKLDMVVANGNESNAILKNIERNTNAGQPAIVPNLGIA